MALPNPFIAPTGKQGIFAYDQFYWDSYFIILGIAENGMKKVARGMVDNLIHLWEKYGIIPARNRIYDLGMSQPPFLTSMGLMVYSERQELKRLAKAASSELKGYWMSESCAEKHRVHKGLSRYCDHHVNHITSEHESGWDMTSRFVDRAMDFLPVDLNSLLYRYEIDLCNIYSKLGMPARSKEYLRAAKRRRSKILGSMWDGFFFDYNFVQKKRRRFYSLAGYYPLWAGLATQEQARALKDSLKRFEYNGGLANTQKKSLSKERRQWDYPNGWPNQQWIVIKGLQDYGYHDDARRLATKWLDLNTKIFKKTGKLWEKYDVVKCKIGVDGRYKTQHGFGWTNGIYLKLVEIFYPEEMKHL